MIRYTMEEVPEGKWFCRSCSMLKENNALINFVRNRDITKQSGKTSLFNSKKRRNVVPPTPIKRKRLGDEGPPIKRKKTSRKAKSDKEEETSVEEIDPNKRLQKYREELKKIHEKDPVVQSGVPCSINTPLRFPEGLNLLNFTRVTSVTGRRKKGGDYQYKLNFEDGSTEWVFYWNCKNLKHLVDAFLEKFADQQRKKNITMKGL
eukprot:TRINITY_DN5680_c0_g1_i3.p1 TRINITY_DN5680_c0_g1~~TRINITY_DN5680_c0_g1_i3.p1  ORF type:complete len:205 (-),score=40.04 TRINITY_DN5680_c0_g1_i3:73-687(-)